MSNPYMVQIPFCNTGNKNAIQLTQQAGQDPEDATYQEGFPPVTMLNEDAGGLPPKGLDFNGIFYELSSPIAHYCRGDRIQFDATYAAAIGGYAKGWVVASNDYQKDYISLVDNNLADPNGTNTTWAVYAGQGSVPTATSTTTGTVKLVNSLSSTATDAALTAAQGKALNDRMLGGGQTWQDVISSRSSGVTYTNNTGRPIQVNIKVTGSTNRFSEAELRSNGVLIAAADPGNSDYTGMLTAIIPDGRNYSLTLGTGTTFTLWAELR
nr:MAG TPA: tail fiber protein [Caudoviricetes sp.]